MSDRPIAFLAALAVIACVLYQLVRPSKLPKVPIVGAKPGEWFALQRARWRNTFDTKTATQTAYDEYRDRACIFPIAGAQTFVQLPLHDAQWLIERPDKDVSVLNGIIDTLQFNHTLMDPKLAHLPAHMSVISGPLTREIGNLIPDLLDEIQFGVDHFWGHDRENYQTVGVFNSMSRIVGQATNRVFIGLPFCRNNALLDAAMAFSLDIPISATLLHFFWQPLRPLVAPLLTLPNRIHTNRAFNILRPEIERRLKEYDGPKTGANDFLQWSIHQAKSLEDPYYGRVDTLAGRVLLNNFTSIHTSSFAITHVILDLASSKQAYIDELREEITSVLAENGGQWTKRTLAAMPKLDSAMRESQRLNSFVITATNRMVANPKGITTPSGLWIPQGTMVCAPSYPVLHDPDLYSDPESFKPFRFADKRTALGEEGESYVQRARQAWTTTSPEYPAFGHGRHACLGRFFASALLKLLLANILLNYDFEIQEKRPENFWFGSNRAPPMKATIRVRRR
ncbi:cytochrome P450 [Aspergillus cavernicola]|uniref:Cytochrome P450 n=1 Tax=Aspergillus cavernicola TaxID=176166 RepID=A0ABR4IAC3_9EURO